MTLEITLRVNGLEGSRNGSGDLPENLIKFLQGFDGVLEARYDTENCRFAVRYDPNRVTILRILNRIELAGRQTGLGYRPTDVQTRRSGSFAPRFHRNAPERPPDPAAGPPVLSKQS